MTEEVGTMRNLKFFLLLFLLFFLVSPIKAKEEKSIFIPFDDHNYEHLKLNIEGSHSVTSVAFSPDGKILASGGWGGTIKLWDVESGALLKTLKSHSKPVSSVSFSPDGKILASGSGDKTIKLWDVKSGTLLKTLEGHFDSVSSVSFSPDGRILASGSGDDTIKLWDVESGALLKTLRGHSESVSSVSFSPDGRILASGSRDNTIKLWGGKLPLEMYNIRGEIVKLEREISRLENERESKIAKLYTKDEFETTKEYQERIARARELEKAIREEYAQKIREIEDKKERMIKEAQLKLVPYETSVVLKNYDADNGGFYAEVEGYEVFIPVERSIARVIAGKRDKAVVKGKLRFVDITKCELVDAFLTVEGTDIMVYGNVN